MSLLLALDSSTDACSVALYDNGSVISHFEQAAKSHTRRLLPLVDEILGEGGYRLGDLDAIAFGRGPGSFTGLRICLGIVQGLAFGSDLPVVPVSTLEAMASGHFRSDKSASDKVLVALDARMNEVYWSLFQAVPGNDEPRQLMDEAVMSPADVANHIAVAGHAQTFAAIGPGWHYPDLQALPVVTRELDVYPDAADMVRLAALKFARGEAVSVMDAEPVYLRNEVSWQKRQRIRGQSSELSE